MSKVEREYGSIEDSELDGNSVLTITVEGIHPMDQDMMDRTLQFVLMELGVDTSWQVPPPEPLPVPPPPEVNPE